jgi:hypothetical protein
MVVRTADLMHAISISDAGVSGPCWLASGLLDLNCDTFLMDERVRTGYHVVRTVATIFPYLCLEKKSWSLIEHWESSGRAAETSGRMQAGVVWSFSTQRKVRTEIHVVRTDYAFVWCASGRYVTSSGRLMHWTAGRPNGMTRRPDGWQGTEFSDLQSVQNLLEHFWITEFLLKSIFTTKWFFQQNVANYKLTNSPFGHSGTKITLPVKNTIPVQIKITPFFCHKGTKGKTE